jgi:hypothetical protein
VTSFRAAIYDLKFTAQGEAKLSLLVPYADRHRMVRLYDEFGKTMTVTIERGG